MGTKIAIFAIYILAVMGIASGISYYKIFILIRAFNNLLHLPVSSGVNFGYIML